MKRWMGGTVVLEGSWAVWVVGEWMDEWDACPPPSPPSQLTNLQCLPVFPSLPPPFDPWSS